MARFFLALLPILLLFLIALLIGSRNTHVIDVNLLLVQLQLKASTLMAFSLGLGFLVGIVAFLSSYLKLRVRYRRLRKELIQHAKANL